MKFTLAPTSSPAPANFSRDLRRLSNVIGAGCGMVATLAIALGIAALAEGSRLNAEAELSELRADRLVRNIAAARRDASDAPAMTVFTALRDRINGLNALDYGATPGVGSLLDALEESLPNDALLTNIDYDRNKGLADLVAVSARSDELTRLFDVLDGHPLFSRVQLQDKKQIAATGAAHTQVNLILDVGQKPAAKTAAVKAGSRP